MEDINAEMNKLPFKIITRGVYALCLLLMLLFFSAYMLKIPLTISCRIIPDNNFAACKRLNITVDNYYSKYFHAHQELKLLFSKSGGGQPFIFTARIASIRSLKDQEGVLTLLIFPELTGITELNTFEENQSVSFKISLLEILIK